MRDTHTPIDPKGHLAKVQAFYAEKKDAIAQRLQDYRDVWTHGGNREIHVELSFCVLTPQSKARSAWAAITALRDNGLLFTGAPAEIATYLHSVRFFNNKAKYLVLLRHQMTGTDGGLITRDFFAGLKTPLAMRDWIVNNIKGMSYKEAGHFIRNVGFGDDIAILDRHILKNLLRLGAIDNIPQSLTPTLYLDIEKKMRTFCRAVGIPMAAMDLLLWCMETGEIFK